MKRRYAWLLGIVLILSLTACGNQTRNSVTNQAPSEAFSTTQAPEESQERPQDETVANSAESNQGGTEKPDTTISAAEAENGPQEEAKPQPESTPQEPTQEEPMNEPVTKLKIEVGGHSFTATLEQNDATAALVDMLPLIISMSDYSGFEKVGALSASLPTSNAQTTTHAGDVVLYNGNQIVIFYGSNSWSYTRLAHVDDLTGWAEALGSGDVTVILSAG